MGRPQGARGLVRIDNRGNVALGGALSDCANVDTGAAERAEESCRDTGTPGHSVADDGNDALAVVHVDALNLAAPEFVGEYLGDHVVRQACDVGRHGYTDRVLGTGLRYQRDGDASGMQRLEQPFGRSGHTDHARAFEVDERHSADGCDALDRVLIRRL